MILPLLGERAGVRAGITSVGDTAAPPQSAGVAANWCMPHLFLASWPSMTEIIERSGACLRFFFAPSRVFLSFPLCGQTPAFVFPF